MAFLLHPHMAEGARQLCEATFIGVLITFTRVNHLPEVPPHNTITLVSRLPIYEFLEEHKHSNHSILFLGSQNSCPRI
jgi:hypothetical protein